MSSTTASFNPLKYKQFMLRRLHSLTGLFLGLFLFNHFLTNSFIGAEGGRDAFNHKVSFIHHIPFLIFVEIGLVFLPLIFHMCYGFYIMFRGEHNVGDYGYGRNYMYSVQRITAWITAAFVIYHIAELRFYVFSTVPHYDESGNFILGNQFFDHLVIQFSKPLFVAVYLIGVLASIVHWANGLCTFCMRWGITISPTAQKQFMLVAVGISLVYAALVGQAFYGLLIRYSFEAPAVSTTLAMSSPGFLF